jgi:predicted nucleic acid-binding protein
VKYLVDANVLSETTRLQPDEKVVEWLREHQSELAVDPIVLGEIRFGILLLPNGARRRKLEKWFELGVEKVHCLQWDSSTGLRWGQLLAELRKKGRAMQIKDSMIAATALKHGLMIATRNEKDFAATGLKIIDPFGGK